MSRHLTPETLVHIAGLSQVPSAPQDSVLLMIDGQREYTSGRLPLVGIDAAVEEGARLLALARSAGMPVFHAIHHGRPGAALFEPSGDGARSVYVLAPLEWSVRLTNRHREPQGRESASHANTPGPGVSLLRRTVPSARSGRTVAGS